MIEIKVNFQQIRDRVEAAAKLQEAGQDVDSRRILRSLGGDIVKSVKTDS